VRCSSASDLSHKEDDKGREAREDGAGERDDPGDHHFHQIVEPIVDPGELMIDAVKTSVGFDRPVPGSIFPSVEASINFVEAPIGRDCLVSGPLFRPIETFLGLLFGSVEAFLGPFFGSVEAFVHPLREFIKSTVGPLCHPPLPLCRDRHEGQAKAEISLSEMRKVPIVCRQGRWSGPPGRSRALSHHLRVQR
jgi:hypothetical protein